MVNIFAIALLYCGNTVLIGQQCSMDSGKDWCRTDNKRFIEHFCSDQMRHPFNYDLGIKVLKSDDERADYLLCCHGSGGNNRIADDVKSYNATYDHIIGFNFPDHDQDRLDDDPRETVRGTIEELLPALYMLKNLVVDGNLSKINLYGFSAGGGVIINTIAVLSNNRFSEQLYGIGINDTNRLRILSAIEQGIVLLDCPLRSHEEIIAFRGGVDKDLDRLLYTYAQRYRDNNLRPIDSVKTWKDMHLKIVLYLEVPDEKLSNRDDALFADLVKKHNAGSTRVIYGFNNGHCGKHDELWRNMIA